MTPVATYRGRWTTSLGTGVLDTAPISVNAGDILVVATIADSYQDLTHASVTMTWPDTRGFTWQVETAYWGNTFDGAYAQVSAYRCPTSGSPGIHVVTSGSAQGHKRPSFEVWTITGCDSGAPVAKTGEFALYGNPINATLRSAAGTAGGTIAIICGGDGWSMGDPWVSGSGVNPGPGYTQPSGGGEAGISGFSTAATWSAPDTNQSLTIDPPGSGAAVYALAFMEFQPPRIPPEVDVGADANYTFGSGTGGMFHRTATVIPNGTIVYQEWTITSGPVVPPYVISFEQTLDYAFPVAGVYVLRYAAVNPIGEDVDTVTITVVGVVPAVDAGVDRTVERTLSIIRTAGEVHNGGSTVTARQWRLMSGPGGSGAPVNLAAYGGDPKRAILPNAVAGVHVIRYTATNATGAGYDEATITVLPLRPTVNAGPDEARGAGVVTRTATEQAGDSPITSRQWKIQEGASGVGTVIGSAAALSWTPPTLGRWVLRYTATSAAGTSDPDDAVITVGLTGVPLKLARTPAPRLAVAIAFGGNLADPDGSEWVFTEVTTDVRVAAGVHLRHGRSDEAGVAQPAACRFTLDNRDGRYSLGGRSPYWPNVRQGTPIQVSVNLGGGFQTLFTGYVDGFTPEWSTVPLAGTQRGDAVVKVSASGSLRRMAQGNPPQISPMRRALSTAAGVVGYWPCEDEQGARQIASGIPGHPPMDFSGRLHGGSNPGLPAATPRLAESSAFVCSAPLPLVSDSEWYGTVPDYVSTNILQLRCLIDVPAAGSNDGAVILGVITSGDPGFWELRYKSGGLINARAWRAWDTLVVDSAGIAFCPLPTGGFTGINGRPGQLGLTLTISGAVVTWTMDFIEQGSTVAYQYSGTVAGTSVGKATRVQTATDGGHFDVALGHVQVRKDARDSAAHVAMLNAWRGENVGQRLLRLAAENQLWSVWFDGPVHNVAITDYMGPQPTGTLLELLRTCEACDQGLLFDGINPGVSYTTKRYRESRAPALTLDATASQVGLPFTPMHDDAYRVNRAAASRRGGSSAVYADETGPLGFGIVGRYEDTLTVDVITDAALIQYAAWMVHQGTCEGYRYPQLSLNLAAAPQLIDEWLAVVPGDRIDVTGVRTVTGAAPEETVSLAVEGYEQTITPSTWHVIMNTSLYRRWAVAQVCAETGDVAEFGARVDTNGSVIATLTAAGQTSLPVDVTAGPAWTTRADDYPLLLDIGAVPVRATGCTAPTGARQTFTIDPMPVTRPPGTRVQLWNPPVFAL